jgi:hypothetical protein
MILPWLGGLIGSSLALSAFAAVPVHNQAAGTVSGFRKARTFDRYQVGQPFLWKDGTLIVPVEGERAPSVRLVVERPDQAWLEVPFSGPVPARVSGNRQQLLGPTSPYRSWQLVQERPGTVRLTLSPRDARSFEARVVRWGKGWQIQLRRRQTVFDHRKGQPAPRRKTRADGKLKGTPWSVVTAPGAKAPAAFAPPAGDKKDKANRAALKAYWETYRRNIFKVGRPRVRDDGTLTVPVSSPLMPRVRADLKDPRHPWYELPLDGHVPAQLRTPTLLHAFTDGPLRALKLAKVRWGTVRLTLSPRGDRTFEHRVVKSKFGWLVEFRPLALPRPVASPTPVPVSASPSPRPQPIPSPSPAGPEPVDPAPVPTPVVTPEPVVEPTPEPSPSPAVEATPSPAIVGEEPDWDPLSRLLLTGARTGLYESYPDGGVVDATVKDINTLALYARHEMTPGWSLEGEFRGFETYTVVDRLLPGSTHTRNDFSVQGASMWDFQQGMFRESVGLGYGFRYLTARHSLEPIAKDFLFSDLQLFQGPVLRADLSVRPWRPLRLYVQGHLQPLTFVLVDPLVDGLPDVRRARLDLGAEFMMDRYVLRVWQTWDQSWRTSTPFQSLAAFGVSAGIRY